MDFKSKSIITNGNLNIFTESLGNESNPALILIMGAMNQGIFWYDKFCKLLSEHNLFIIRYDHRDTGFSSKIDFKKNPYNLDDLANDVVEILKGYKINKAYIVGISMGGYIGQILSVKHPEVVNTLTLISTTADHRPYMDATANNFTNTYQLTFPNKIFLDYLQSSNSNPPKNKNEFREFHIRGWKIMLGKKALIKDVEELGKLIDLSNERNNNNISALNHGLAVSTSKDRLKIVHNIKAPTLIIHGTDDVCFSLEHAIFLNKEISNSRLEIIEGMGHMFAHSQSKIIFDKIAELVNK